jgi:hypothetical protein
MIEFFTNIKPVFIILHAFSAAIGLGAIVVTDTLFFKFLEDFKISDKEDQTMRTISKLVWVAIILLFITGLVLYLSAPMGYLAKSKFVVKLVIFVIIVLNGALLNWYLTPHLKKIAFGPVIIEPSKKLRFLRRLAFASGVVSIVSWVSVFLLGSLRSIPLTVAQGLLIYVGICFVGIIGSQLYATWVKRKSLW